MRVNRLGNTGLFVSELCLGTMTFGGGDEGLWSSIGNLQQDEADGLLRTATEAGINFIDTADVYGAAARRRSPGRRSRISGSRATSSCSRPNSSGQTGEGANQRGASRYHIIDAVKASLKRLQLDHIDLYQIHGVDPATPIEETLRALDTLVQHGHVRYIGVSNWAAWQIAKALGMSERLGLARFESLQAYYTVAGRDLERDIVPMLQSEKVGLMVWSPLAGGFLSGKYTRDDEKSVETAAAPPSTSRRSTRIAAMR